MFSQDEIIKQMLEKNEHATKIANEVIAKYQSDQFNQEELLNSFLEAILVQTIQMNTSLALMIRMLSGGFYGTVRTLEDIEKIIKEQQ
jgi:hypothetical protein